jgi:hypothetical protein
MMTLRRIPAVVLMAFLSASVACTTLTGLLGGGTPPPVLPGTAEPQMQETSTQAAQATQSNEPRRLQLPNTPTPFHVTSSDDVRSTLDLAKPSYVDYFDQPGTWFDYDTPGRASYSFEDGHLLGKDYEPETFYTWWSYSDHQSGNVYAEISATNGDCIAKDAVGFVIRVDQATSAGGYGIEVSCDGEWQFLRYRQGKQAQVMAAWAAADVIKTGPNATNRLGLWAYQNHFIVFLNGKQVGELYDRNNAYTFGTFAVYVRASQTYDLTAQFDDFAFWNIPFISP